MQSWDQPNAASLNVLTMTLFIDIKLYWFSYVLYQIVLFELTDDDNDIPILYIHTLCYLPQNDYILVRIFSSGHVHYFQLTIVLKQL